MEHIYQIIKIKRAFSQRNQTAYYEIVMQDILTEKLFKTYVDPTMRNWANWEAIVSNSHLAQLITAVKNKKDSIIDADSKPDIVWQGCPEHLEQKLNAWRSEA